MLSGKSRWLLLPGFVFGAVLLAAQATGTRTAPPSDPNPDLTPEQVVRLQVEALRRNNDPDPDSGIRLAFRFASPSNRAVTGPIDRFTTMVKTPVYAPMLNHETARYSLVNVDGNEADQEVTLRTADGQVATYRFLLTRETEGTYKGCWMTSGVVRITKKERAIA